MIAYADYGIRDYGTYEYDKFGNANKKYLNGTLAYEGITDNTGAVTKAIDHVNNLRYDNTYDSTDRLISSTITNTENNKRKAMFEYDFDLNNNLSKLTTLTPNGRNKVLYTYGDDNRLTEVTLNNNKKVNYSYNGIGHLTSRTVTLPSNPITTTYTYHGIEDSDHTVYKNNLIRIETIGNNDFTYLYNYDNNNNIIRIYNGTYDEQLEDYSYDNLGQLTKAEYLNRNERHNYTYDNGGNITEEKVYDTSGSTPVLTSTNTYTYGDTDGWGDLLTSYNNNTITYDEIGNPLSYRDGISFTWSNGRQLQSYTKNNSTINYTYDSSGMRLSKDVGNIHYTYLYQNGLLVQETIGEKILDYSYTSGGQILSVRYKANANDSGTYYYYALNSRGDVIGLYDHTGVLYAKYTYDVWGNPVSVTNASGSEITSPTAFANIQPIRYRIYYYDSDTGLYYLQSRYYDPVTHRFINADNIGEAGNNLIGMNQFAYCGNNPVNRCDSSGHFWLTALIVTVVVAAVVATVGYCHVSKRNSRQNSKVDSDSNTTTKNKIINDQNGTTGNNFEYGLYDASWNACETIAVHNAKVLKGIESSLSETMTDFQAVGAMIGYGYFGSNPIKIGSVLSYEGIDYSRVGLNEMTESGTYIISFWNENPLENGLHTVAISYDGMSYTAYNLDCYGESDPFYPSDYSTRFICGYYLR